MKETSQDHAIECGDEEGQNLPVELNSESSQDKSNENDIEGDQKLPVELNHETSEDNTKEDDDEGGQKLPVELNQEVQFKIGSYIEVEYELNRGRKKECKKYVGEIIDAVNDEPYVSFVDN
ncbi:uncharacterized protein LOC128551739 [Mercenaria mercenaria]|uniref:uncharacterized protein LOC128551739 n=1 Tax=Mercenaria mercenaria TaxID=6596 RepID=UPI00234F78DF|nr:uncharacterized protein LOC128551739 [Mercenaria mercenaria]